MVSFHCELSKMLTLDRDLVNYCRCVAHQVTAKLQTAESTIETLTIQLMSLGESDTLTHTREQHRAFVAGLQQKHETEILRLNEMLDTSKRATNEKVRRCLKDVFLRLYFQILLTTDFFKKIIKLCIAPHNNILK